MDAYERAKEVLAVQTLRGMLRITPDLTDRTLMAFARRGIEGIEWPEGQQFLRRMLDVAQEALDRASPACRDRAVRNMVINSSLRGPRLRHQFEQRTGIEPPFLLVISPTMRCNLRCYGCYAGGYSVRDDLPRELFDRVLNEAKEMGIFFITISGGEPFVSQDVLDMFEKHQDVYFQVYTNGTLIDEPMARRLSELGNVFPAISVEGFREQTDGRRGEGTFEKILRAMAALREAGVLFGFSATATRRNNDLIVSDEFIEFYVERGCLLGWYFQYIPIGRAPDMDLMPTAEQRIRRLRALRDARQRYPILLADFWNDGPLVGGCIAGGRSYLHINVHGDVEPCVFAHFAVDNIRDKSLAEALQSAFFRAIQARQPYSENLLRPCMIIDRPEVLREVVKESGAHPTYPGAEATLTELAGQLDENAECYRQLADEEWSRSFASSASALAAVNEKG